MNGASGTDGYREAGRGGGRRRAAFVGAALAVVAMGVLGASTGGAAAPAAGAPGSREIQISIDKHQFRPATVTVRAGTKITWVNHDTDIHTATSATGAFASPGLDTDERFSFVAGAAGSYAYTCALHPQMRGRIIVK